MDRMVHVGVAWALYVSCMKMTHQRVLGEARATVITMDGGLGAFLVRDKSSICAAQLSQSVALAMIASDVNGN